jgi:two-component system, OmpR family, response regulator
MKLQPYVSAQAFCNGLFLTGSPTTTVTISRGPLAGRTIMLAAETRQCEMVMQRAPHLLVVDDDVEIRDLLSTLLTRRGYRVTIANDEPGMRRVLASSRIDLIILDLMLPGKDGLTICRELRASKSVPIVMLTARGDATDRVVGLEMGADDYLPKPFDVRELEARIKAVLRRVSGEGKENREAASIFRFKGWELDARQRQLLSPDGVVVDLTTGEFDLLLAFVQRPQRVLSRDQLLDLARGRDAASFDRSIDVQVSRLRRKIEIDSKEPELIKTVRSGGYLFTPVVERL